MGACRGPECPQAMRRLSATNITKEDLLGQEIAGELEYFQPACSRTAKWAEIQGNEEKAAYKIFYLAAFSIAGSCFAIWWILSLCISVDGGCGPCGGGHDKYENSNCLTHNFWAMTIAGFAASRVFDMMSDWALYEISLANPIFEECSEVLLKPDVEIVRRISLAFCIIGTILTPFDLLSLGFRYDAWTRNQPDIGNYGTIAFCTCLVVWLEDVPQLVLSKMYLDTVNDPGCIFNATEADREQYNEVAEISLGLSAASLAVNFGIGVHFLWQSEVC